MSDISSVEKYIESYPFLQYIKEDKSYYQRATDAGYKDPNNLFMIGESGGFLLDIREGDRFVNTNLFQEMANLYHINGGKYTLYKEDSIPHRQLRKREEYRRTHGYEAPCFMRNGVVHQLHISGAMYNYLNYIVIEQLDEKSIIHTDKGSVAKKKQDFPKFIDAQFWTFAIIEFCELNGFHLLIDKTRRGGFSYIMASHSANKINLEPNKVCIHVAADSKYLTKRGGLTDFTIRNLYFYENNTFFKRGILSRAAENFTLGFKLPNGDVSPKSWNSALFSASANNNPDCAIGKDAVSVKTEEVSTMENFDEYMNVTEPAMRTGSYVTGNLFAWGTATSGNMQVFEMNFYNPKKFHFMSFENVWDKDSRNEVCGYFKPYCWGLQGQIGNDFAMDKDGNSDIVNGLRIAYRERVAKKESSKSFSDYINYLGQYANMPSESFSSTSENLFSSEALMNWEEILKNDPAYTDISDDGMFFETIEHKVIFKTNARIKAEGGKFNVDYFDWIEGVPRKAHEHHHGCVRKWFEPIHVAYRDKEGHQVMGIPPGQYSISYDPVGVDKENEGITNKHSHNSIKVWENPTQYNQFKTRCVCAYYGRPEKLEDADRICYYMARYYNCIGTTGVEVNRGETVSNFTKWKALKYLMKDPVELWDSSIKAKLSASYGVNMGGGNGQGGTKVLEGLRLLNEMLYSKVGQNYKGEDIYLFQTIYDHQSILELLKWNVKGNFDRVSEMIIRALQWRVKDLEAAKELLHRKKATVENYSDDIWNREWF
uniref:Terminase large subunit n=1 Tax=Geladintestivirus 4 TaxID=3233136 RepID=A0AAU8MKI7_9CAUD